MRNLRWAAELSVSRDDAKAKLGVAQLNALGDSAMLDEAQQLFIDAALTAVVEDLVEKLKEDPDAETIRVAALRGIDTRRGTVVQSDVSSDEESELEGSEDGAG